jgi:polyisoprenoid-binding protein YceI
MKGDNHGPSSVLHSVRALYHRHRPGRRGRAIRELDREAPGSSGVEVEIDTASVDTNHAERDKHLRSSDFLHVDEHPTARFVSTMVERTGEGAGVIRGELTLKGVTNPVEIAFEEIGHGPDPWGGYRAGFIGTTTLRLADFGIDYDLGPASQTVELTLSVEGVRR